MDRELHGVAETAQHPLADNASILRRRGRPRKGEFDSVDEQHAHPSSESAAHVLLRRLVAEPEWLRTPESENQIAMDLRLPKSSAREAIQQFIRIRALRRDADGIVRDYLQSDRVTALFALRLSLEAAAFRRLSEPRFDKQRECIALDLNAIVLAQESYAANDDDFMKWLEEGMNFHCEILNKADIEDLSHVLRSVLLQIRIASYMTPDNHIEREAAVKQHFSLVQLIKKKSDRWDKGEWQASLEKHLKLSMGNILSARRARHQRYATSGKLGGKSSESVLPVAESASNNDPSVPDDVWDEVLEIANMTTSK